MKRQFSHKRKKRAHNCSENLTILFVVNQYPQCEYHQRFTNFSISTAFFSISSTAPAYRNPLVLFFRQTPPTRKLSLTRTVIVRNHSHTSHHRSQTRWKMLPSLSFLIKSPNPRISKTSTTLAPFRGKTALPAGYLNFQTKKAVNSGHGAVLTRSAHARIHPGKLSFTPANGPSRHLCLFPSSGRFQSHCPEI